MRRRRRRRLVNWLPVQPADDSTSGLTHFAGAHDGTATGAPVTDQITSLHTVVRDIPAETLAGLNFQSLADYEQSGYMLQRIVGKVHGALTQYDDQQNPPVAAVLVTCGFMILRVDTANGLALQAATPNKYATTTVDNTRDPWIARRSWLVSNDLTSSTSTADNGWLYMPRSTADYGAGVFDGTHFDIKGKRRVGPEERLYFVMTTCPVYPTNAGSWHWRWVHEFRVLASPLRMSNRRNASR